MAGTWSAGSPLLRRFHSQRKSERLIKQTNQFRATHLWNSMISHLRIHVQIKRRRHMMKTYDSCFTGSDAVDIILRYLLEDNENFGSADISREKAVKLCQAFMDNNVYEPVQTKVSISSNSERKTTFEDSGAKFYRFIEDNPTLSRADSDSASEGTDLPRKDPRTKLRRRSGQKCLSTSEVKDFVIGNPGVIKNPGLANQRGHIIQEILSIKETVGHKSVNVIKTVSPSIFQRRQRPSLSSVFGSPSPGLPCSPLVTATPDLTTDTPSVIVEPVRNCISRVPIHPGKKFNIPKDVQEQMKKEVSLARLLTLIDLPVLEDVLSETRQLPQSFHNDMAFENMAFTNKKDGRAECKDWMTSALDCLENIPAGISLVTSLPVQCSTNQHKLRLYKTIADYYKSSRIEAILPDSCEEIYVELERLLCEEKFERCQKALQLFVVILPSHVQKELNNLLRFMHETVQDSSLNNHYKGKIHSKVAATFCSAVLKTGSLSDHQRSALVSFMMNNCVKLSQTPREVKQAVRQSVTHKKDLDPFFDLMYCSRISEKEFIEQRKEYTNWALCALLDSHLDNVSLSLKEKKTRLKQFQKHYPELHNKHFSNMDW